MALKAQVDSLDAVPEAQRSLYTQTSDGKYVLDVEGGEEVFGAGARKAQRELLDDLKKAQAKLKGYDGVDPEEFKRLKKAADDAAAAAARATGDWETREKQLKEQFERETTALKSAAAEAEKKLKGELETADGFIQRTLVENVLRKELEPVALSVDLLIPHAASRVRVVKDETTGERRAVVVDEKGNARIRDAQGNAFTIADLVKEMSTQPAFAPAFKGNGSSGSGAKGSGAPTEGTKRIPAGDNAAFIENLEGIATGKVQVAG